MTQTFNRTKLAAAVAVALGASAGAAPSFAVNLSDNGLGEVAIVPYYTTRNGIDTNISVVNTSDKYVVAFKIRFREGDNSRDARDFNVFLSPNDVWTATVAAHPSADGNPDNAVPYIQTYDRSCMAPWIGTDPNTSFVNVGTAEQPILQLNFTNIGYAGGAQNLPADGGDTSIKRAQEGHIEIIEMGQSDPDVAGNTIAQAAMHPNPNCPAIVNTYLQQGNAPFNDQFNEPLNVLKVAANLISVGKGASGGLPVETLQNFFNTLITGVDDPNDPRDLMDLPFATTPNLGLAEPPNSVQVTSQNGAITANFDTNPYQGADAVSSLFMSTDVINEYAIGGAAEAQTDWVVTFPTKYVYTDTISTRGIAPFEEQFHNGVSCVTVNFDYYDREENGPTTPPGSLLPSPLPETIVKSDAICQEAQTLQFGTASLLGSDNNYQVPLETGFENGWMRLGFPKAGQIVGRVYAGSPPAPTGNTVTFAGLPVVGFSIKGLNNGVVQNGVLLNYGIIARHAFYRDITVSP